MATITDSYTVRSITVDGELVSETEALDQFAGWATFEDTIENVGEGIVVQLIAEDGRVIAENIFRGELS